MGDSGSAGFAAWAAAAADGWAATGKLGPMGSIGRYIFRTTIGAFVIICTSLTIVLWFTQAIREFDLITSQRQSVFVFVGMTGLLIPLLVMMIAPIAFAIAAAHSLNKFSTDSEIIVMNAAGVSPWRLLYPLVAAALVVSLLVGFIAAYLSPLSLRKLRDWGAEVRADILTNIVQPGRFTTIGGNLTFHIADRRPNGLLIGIFVDDGRDPKEHATYLAEEGETVKNETGSFLVLERGSIQRREVGQRDPRIVTFDRYAFDLSKFTTGPQNIVYSAHEKFFWELLWPPTDDPASATQKDQYRSELADRLAGPLYPLTFVVLAYIFLGPPQTTRQSRTLAMFGLVGAVALLRLVGFISVILGVRVPSFLALQYIMLVGAMAVGLWQTSRGKAIEPAGVISKIASVIGERVARATAT